MKIYHYTALFGFSLVIIGFIFNQPYPFHIGVLLSSVQLYSIYLQSVTWQRHILLNGFLFMIIWYLNFECAAWLSSESMYGDAILRFIGLTPLLYVVFSALKGMRKNASN